MSGNCETCGNWIVRRKNVYSDRTEIVTWDAPMGKGNCKVLNIETGESFGCLSYENGSHVEITVKVGAPWQNWHQGDCPDCNGRGSTAFDATTMMCKRCCGTGLVRHYDDGFIGEESTRRHPKEPPPCTPIEDPATILKPLESPIMGLL